MKQAQWRRSRAFNRPLLCYRKWVHCLFVLALWRV